MPLGFFEQFKKEKTHEEQIQEDIQGAEEELLRYEEQFGKVPEKLAPLFKLHIFDNRLLERNAFEGALPDAQKEVFKFHKIVEEEQKAEESPYLPTIGVEIEIPRELRSHPDRALYRATEDLGIPNGYDQEWEFVTPFSYSAKAQSALVHELIRGGYIPTESVAGVPKIAGAGDFSLHINLGIPPEIVERFGGDEERTYGSSDSASYIYKAHETGKKLSPFESYIHSVDVLTNAFTYAFTSPERISKRKTTTRFYSAANISQAIDKKKKNKDEKILEGGRRMEIRSLEARDKTLYRMLTEIQLLASTLFSAHQKISTQDSQERELAALWFSFEAGVEKFIKAMGLNFDTLDNDFNQAVISLKFSGLQDGMREFITATSLSAEGIMRKAEKEIEKSSEL